MKRIFTQNPWMKFFSLLLAFIFWLAVRVEQHGEINVISKVVLKNIPDNLVVAGDVETDVRIRLSGPKMRLRQLRESDLESIVIDLQDAKVGVNAFTLYGDEFRRLPQGVHVTRIVPQIIRVALDHVEERLVKVEPVFTGQIEEGFELGSVQVEPPYIRVKGAKSDLQELTVLKTTPISVQDRTEPFQGEYSLRAYPTQWGLQDKKVRVSIDIHAMVSK